MNDLTPYTPVINKKCKYCLEDNKCYLRMKKRNQHKCNFCALKFR